MLALASPATAASNCATKDGFDQIREGMSYELVVQILGCDGEVMSSSEMAGFRTVMYGWKASGFVAAATGGNMNAMFQNGRMVSKAQFGLR
jgi:hypothetical protein